MKNDGQAFCEVPEVRVGREDRQFAPDGDGAEEEVGVRALNALGSAKVEKFRGGYEILRAEMDVGECGEVGFQTREPGLDPQKKGLEAIRRTGTRPRGSKTEKNAAAGRCCFNAGAGAHPDAPEADALTGIWRCRADFVGRTTSVSSGAESVFEKIGPRASDTISNK